MVPPAPCFWLLKRADVRARAAKMCGGARTRTESPLLDRHAIHATVHWKRHTLPAEQGFGDRQSFFAIYGFECGFPGLLGAAEPRKMRTLAQRIGRLVLRMVYCALAGGFRAHAF